MDATATAAEDEAATNEALADAVDAYRAVVRLARTAPNSAYWRAACRNHHRASRTYAALTGMTMPEIAAKVRTITECFTTV